MTRNAKPIPGRSQSGTLFRGADSTTYVKTMTTPKPELKSPNYGYGFGLIPEEGIVAHSCGAEGIGAHLEMTDGGYTFVVLSNYGSAMSAVTLRLREMITAGGPRKTGTR